MTILERNELLEELASNENYVKVLSDIYNDDYRNLTDEQLMLFVENRKVHPNDLTIEETNRVIEHKVPMDLRLKAVYVPIVSAFIAIGKFKQAVDILTALRVKTIKKMISRMKETINDYDVMLYRQMGPELYRQVQKAVESIVTPNSNFGFSNAGMFLDIFDNTLYSEAEDKDASYEDLTDIVVKMLTAIEFSKHVHTLDKEYAAYINEACGRLVTYSYREDQHLRSLIDDASFIVEVIDLPELMTQRAIDAKEKLFSVLDQIDVKLINEF